MASTIKLGAVLVTASFVASDAGAAETLPTDALSADILFLGEQHDNAAHHRVQADWVEAIKPTAVVFEMLTPAQAKTATKDIRQDKAALETALSWQESGWPDFSMYFPIFTAASGAEIIGAGVPREQLRALMDGRLEDIVEQETVVLFGLDKALPEEQQTSRETLQRVAHCDALPEDVLPRMVNVQRLRDAALSQAALDAFEKFGSPVVVITGNGHARADWGAPFLLQRAAPELPIFSMGQGEDGQAPDGAYSVVVDGPSVDRGDLCGAFR